MPNFKHLTHREADFDHIVYEVLFSPETKEYIAIGSGNYPGKITRTEVLSIGSTLAENFLSEEDFRAALIAEIKFRCGVSPENVNKRGLEG